MRRARCLRFVSAENLTAENDVPRNVGILSLMERTGGEIEFHSQPMRKEEDKHTISMRSLTLPFDSVPIIACSFTLRRPPNESGQSMAARTNETTGINTTSGNVQTFKMVPIENYLRALLLTPYLS